MRFAFQTKANKSERGQGFVELALVVIFLMILLAGVVELGFALNNYLNLIDASREAVRYSSDFDPFYPDCDRSDPACLDFRFFDDTGKVTQDVLAPLVLDPAKGDDIVISFFSVGGGVYDRYPNNEGWSVYGNHVSQIPDSEIQSRLNGSAPPTGVLLVEIYYNYPQVIKMPVFTQLVPDPIPLYVYAIMPLAAAEPIPTPTP